MTRNPDIFDTQLIEHYRQRALNADKEGADFLLAHMADDLEERLLTVDRKFQHGIDLHGHTGLASVAMMQSGKVSSIERIETSEKILRQNPEGLPQSEHDKVKIRAREFLDLPETGADLIVSLLSLHLTNDTPGVLVQIRQALKPDGLFLGVMAASGTLGELRESLLQAESEIYGGVTPRIYPFTDVRDTGALLQRVGFALPVADTENLTVRYDTIFDLMRDLRAMGMQNGLIGRSRRPVSRRFFIRAAEIYAERFSDPDGRIRATFSFVWMSGWAPHKDQQKPMTPGTATRSLADALAEHEK